LLLLRHGTAEPEATDAAQPLSAQGKEEAAFAADGLCAYLELPGNFTPKATGEPCSIKIAHSGKARAVQTAEIIKATLSKAGCDVDCAEAKDELAPKADVEAAVALVTGSSAPLTVLVGHLPHLHALCTAFGVAAATEVFTPAGGVLLEVRDEHGGKPLEWMLAHHVVPPSAKKDWWIHGVSKYVPSQSAHVCPCTECTCGDDCQCAPGSPGCDPCKDFQKAKAAAAETVS